MAVGDYLRIFRRFWWVVLLATLIGVAVGYASTFLSTTQYSSTTRLFVTTQSGTSVGDAYQNNLFSQERVFSYAGLATSDQVAARAIAQLKAPISVEELRSKITAVPMPQTVLLDITATDPDLLIGTLTLAFISAFMVPSVRTRLLGTLSQNDAGATDRVDSIREFPGRMDGHWLFGWGWSQREFKDGAYAFLENFVSNAPLIAIHRGGIFVGLAFLGVVAIGCVIGYRLLRANSLPRALYGGVFIGFSFVALNLDHPVVVIPQIVFLYTIFLTFLAYADQLRVEAAESDERAARVEEARKFEDPPVAVPAGG